MRGDYKRMVDIKLLLPVSCTFFKTTPVLFLTRLFWTLTQNDFYIHSFFKCYFLLCFIFYHWQRKSISDWSNYRVSWLGSHTGTMELFSQAEQSLRSYCTRQTHHCRYLLSELLLYVTIKPPSCLQDSFEDELMLSDSAKHRGLSYAILWRESRNSRSEDVTGSQHWV